MVVARVSTRNYYACYTHIQGNVGYLIYIGNLELELELSWS